MLTSGVDFANMKYVLQAAETNSLGEVVKEEVAIGYGVLINAVLEFIIVAFAIFVVIRVINKAKDKLAKKKEEAPEETPKDIELLTEIRDLLKKS